MATCYDNDTLMTVPKTKNNTVPKPTPAPANSMVATPDKKIGLMGSRWAALYGMLLLPVVAYLFLNVTQDGYLLPDTMTLSKHMPELWRGNVWYLPDYGANGTRLILDVMAFGMMALSTWLYVMGWQSFKAFLTHAKDKQASQQDAASENAVLKWVFICGLILVFVVPFHSRDLYGYINRGAQIAFYGINPLIQPVGDMPYWQTDPLFHNHWLNNPSPYGFLYLWVAGSLAKLSFHDFGLAFVLFKSFSLAIHVFTTQTLMRVVKKLSMSHAWFYGFLFGFNPLILLHTIGNGHNDTIVGLLVLLSIEALLSQRARWTSLIWLTASVLVKYITIVLAPFLLLYLWYASNNTATPKSPTESFSSTLLKGVSGSLLLLIVLALPFVFVFQPEGIWAIDKFADNAGMSQHSLHSSLARLTAYIGKWFFGATGNFVNTTRVFWKWVCLVVFTCIYGKLLLNAKGWFQTQKKPLQHVQDLTAVLVLVLSALLLIGSPKFNGWYIAMVFPLACLLPLTHRLNRFYIVLTTILVLGFTPLENIHIINGFLLIGVPLFWLYSTTLKEARH